MTRLTIMTTEEIATIRKKLKELKTLYFNALDNFDYDLASELDKEIVKLNNSIR